MKKSKQESNFAKSYCLSAWRTTTRHSSTKPASSDFSRAGVWIPCPRICRLVKCKVVSVAPQSYREYAILLMDFIVFITPGCFLRITTIPSGLASGAWRIPVLQLDRRGFHPSDWVGNFECFCGVFTSSLGYGVAPRWMPCRAPVRCITTLSVLERLQHMEQLHLQVFRPVFGKNICIHIYDYSARKQRMALWESAAEGLWISSQLKVMFKGPEALGWFGGKLQYHAILRWKKVYNLRR